MQCARAAPNNRFDLCVPEQAITLVDIMPVTQASACGATPDMYTLPASPWPASG